MRRRTVHAVGSTWGSDRTRVADEHAFRYGRYAFAARGMFVFAQVVRPAVFTVEIDPLSLLSRCMCSVVFALLCRMFIRILLFR